MPEQEVYEVVCLHNVHCYKCRRTTDWYQSALGHFNCKECGGHMSFENAETMLLSALRKLRSGNN